MSERYTAVEEDGILYAFDGRHNRYHVGWPEDEIIRDLHAEVAALRHRLRTVQWAARAHLLFEVCPACHRVLRLTTDERCRRCGDYR